MFLCKLYIAFNDNFRTLHGNDLAGILIHKILGPCLNHTSCELLANNFLEVIASNLDFLC